MFKHLVVKFNQLGMSGKKVKKRKQMRLKEPPLC